MSPSRRTWFDPGFVTAKCLAVVLLVPLCGVVSVCPVCAQAQPAAARAPLTSLQSQAAAQGSSQTQSPAWASGGAAGKAQNQNPASSSGAVSGPPAVDWKAGKLSVRAEKAPLSQVLQKIADSTGMDIQGLEKAAGTVTIEFSGVSLAEGLQKLLPDYDYALSEGDPAAARSHLIILESLAARNRQAITAKSDAGTPAANAPPQGEQDPELLSEDQQRKLEEIQAASQNRDTRTLEGYIQDPDATIQSAAVDALSPIDQNAAADALLSAAKSDNPSVAQGALTILTGTDTTDDQTVLAALGEGLNHKASTVRVFAAQALAGHGKDAMDYLERALKDPDPAVRMAVVQGAGQNQWGIPLLREALTDKDESVRKSAAALLQHAPQTGEAESESQ